jgi:hypothetical protein
MRPGNSEETNPIKMNEDRILFRLILPLVARGYVGKSTLMVLLACWLLQRRVPWRGFDLDGNNRTLKSLFPGETELREISGAADQDVLVNILRRSVSQEITLVDPRAHLDTDLIQVIRRTNYFGYAAERQLRITVPVFVGDDVDILENVAQVVDYCRDNVDYVIVHNPHRNPRQKMFRGSPLEATLINDYGAKNVTIEPLYDSVRLKWLEIQTQLGRGVTPLEFTGNEDLGADPLARAVMAEWLRDSFRRFDGVASHLLTSALLANLNTKETTQNQPVAPARKRGSGYNYGE